MTLQKKHLIPLILINLLLGAWVLACSMPTGQEPPTRAGFRQQLPTLLQDSWAFYKGRFLVDGAHVVSNTYGGTISEGQSYALLKAVWMNDPATFRKVWTWTKTNMDRPNDHLLGWKWGELKDGSEGLIDSENAADADQDIAYALLLAGERWKEPLYIENGKAILRDLWRLNVTRIDGRYYLIPGTWEGFRWEYLTIDPSYMAPYVYRKFAEYDKTNAVGWTQLADDVYDTLEACTDLTESKLPPNWCAVKYKDDGGPRIVFSDRQGEGARDFSYDAFRVYWRMAMDAALSPAPGRDRARAYLKNHPFLLSYWQKHQRLPEGFHPDGMPRGDEHSGFPAGPAVVLNRFNPTLDEDQLYHDVLGRAYHADGYWFNDYNDFMHSVIWLHLYALTLQ